MIVASSVVLSIFSPLASFSSTPNSSMNAPLVPEPSSREYTEISSSVSKSAVAAVFSASAVISVAAVVSAVSVLQQPASIAAVSAMIINKLTVFFFIMFSPFRRVNVSGLFSLFFSRVFSCPPCDLYLSLPM